MIRVNPYLNFPGTTEEAFNFYKTVFGGEFLVLQRYGETPDGEKMPEAAKGKIMHVALPLGKDGVLMATDVLESMGYKLTTGNNFAISIDTDNKAEADKLFAGLSAGGDVELEMQDMFWGAYFGMLIDKFGIKWMINCDGNTQK